MSSSNKVDKNGLAYFWSKATGYIQQALAYAQDSLIFIGNTPMGTVATTITGAIKQIVDKIGSSEMGTTADTITGAIAEHEQDISDLKTKVQAGTGNTDSNGELSISFSPAFASTPVIVATAHGSAATTLISVKVKQQSASGATLLALSVNGSNVYPAANNSVKWVAVGI